MIWFFMILIFSFRCTDLINLRLEMQLLANIADRQTKKCHKPIN